MGYTFDTDGKMTVQLRNAVKEFQRAYGLEVDGLVGPNTRLYLNAAYKYQKIIVSGSYLNIRTNPTTSSLSLAKVPRGTILSYIETAYTNGVKWYKISYNNIVGYVSAQYTKDTFVEVDITSQTLRLYKERLLILDTPITTGKPGSYDTQKGYYSIMFIDQDRYLQPSNVHVDYWMRFNNAKAQGLQNSLNAFGSAFSSSAEGFSSVYNGLRNENKAIDYVLAGTDTVNKVDYLIANPNVSGNRDRAFNYWKAWKDKSGNRKQYADEIASVYGFK